MMQQDRHSRTVPLGDLDRRLGRFEAGVAAQRRAIVEVEASLGTAERRHRPPVLVAELALVASNVTPPTG
jgi:hypothetical protein